MKAKEYFSKLMQNETENEFVNCYEEILFQLVTEVETLIEARNAKSMNAIKSCILEINQKYVALVNLLNKAKITRKEDRPYLAEFTFLEDGFRDIYCEIHKDYEWVFKGLKRQNEKPNIHNYEPPKELHLHRVTPFEKLTMDNLTTELLNCMASLGSFASVCDGNMITLDCARPLAYRISLLRYWLDKGEINLDDVKDFEKDPEAWVRKHSRV